MPRFSRADPHSQPKGDKLRERMGLRNVPQRLSPLEALGPRPRPAQRYFPGTPGGQALAAALEAQHHQSDHAPSWVKPLPVSVGGGGEGKGTCTLIPWWEVAATPL